MGDYEKLTNNIYVILEKCNNFSVLICGGYEFFEYK